MPTADSAQRLRRVLFSINGETGIEVPNGDVEENATAMRRLAEGEGLQKRLGSAGKRRVENSFLNTQFRETITETIRNL